MEDWSKYEPKFRYMMLSRMKQDCEYYLRIKAGSPYILWAGSAKAQIENMKAIWNAFSIEDKPEWLTWDEIKEYAIKEDYILKLVGTFGLKALKDCGLIEPCGVVNGRQLYSIL